MSNYAKINDMDVINGSGVRVSVFFSGCTHKCKNCFNSELWNFDYGEKFTGITISTIIDLMKPNYISGLSILGGEPFDNITAVKRLTGKVKDIYPEKNIWIWSGYTYEQLLLKEPAISILHDIDILVDGRFEEDKKDLTLHFRGSSNQRIIDVKKSLESNSVVLYEEVK